MRAVRCGAAAKFALNPPGKVALGGGYEQTHTQDDILSINQVQLLLSEKRTSLAVMRTGIAILALPLSVFSVLIATSDWYNPAEVWPLLALVTLINLLLIAFAVYLIVRSLRRMRRYDQLITGIKQEHESLKKLIR